VRFHPAPGCTAFLSRRLYIVRLYKLVEVPAVGAENEDQEEREVAGGDGSDRDQNGDGDDEASASEPGDASPSDSDDDSSESESDPDKGKHNKKRQAKHALRGSPPTKRRKSTPAARETNPAPRKRVVRVHHQILRPEVYTTLRAANSAACELQRDIMNEQTLPSAGMQEGNAARLRRKLMELVEGGEARYWHDEFAVGLAGARMEIAVEDVCVSGPRNV
jgi:hypothetical protein